MWYNYNFTFLNEPLSQNLNKILFDLLNWDKQKENFKILNKHFSFFKKNLWFSLPNFKRYHLAVSILFLKDLFYKLHCVHIFVLPLLLLKCHANGIYSYMGYEFVSFILKFLITILYCSYQWKNFKSSLITVPLDLYYYFK